MCAINTQLQGTHQPNVQIFLNQGHPTPNQLTKKHFYKQLPKQFAQETIRTPVHVPDVRVLKKIEQVQKEAEIQGGGRGMTSRIPSALDRTALLMTRKVLGSVESHNASQQDDDSSNAVNSLQQLEDQSMATEATQHLTSNTWTFPGSSNQPMDIPMATNGNQPMDIPRWQQPIPPIQPTSSMEGRPILSGFSAASVSSPPDPTAARFSPR